MTVCFYTLFKVLWSTTGLIKVIKTFNIIGPTKFSALPTTWLGKRHHTTFTTLKRLAVHILPFVVIAVRNFRIYGSEQEKKWISLVEIFMTVFEPKENYCDIMVSVECVSSWVIPDELPVSKKYFWYDSLEDYEITQITTR